MSILLLFPRQSLYEATARQTLFQTDRNLKRAKYTHGYKTASFGLKIFPKQVSPGP